MKTKTQNHRSLFPLEINPALLIEDVDGLVELITSSTDEQVAQKDFAGDVHADFAMSCDALNFWRVYWRCCEEMESKSLDEYAELANALCSIREYDVDEFEMALGATKDRVRVPFGLDPLELAVRREKQFPIQLLRDNVSEGSILNKIAGIARQLQEQQNDKSILLPIDALREALGVRKVVVSGAVLRLMQEKIVEDIGEAYHTGKARQFRFLAQEGTDYKRVARE